MRKQQRERFQALRSRELREPLTETEQQELDTLIRVIEEEEAVYLRPANERIREETRHIEEQNAAIRNLLAREQKLTLHLQQVLEEATREREAIKTELTQILNSQHMTSGAGK